MTAMALTQGAQLFQAVGLDKEVISKCFTGCTLAECSVQAVVDPMVQEKHIWLLERGMKVHLDFRWLSENIDVHLNHTTMLWHDFLHLGFEQATWDFLLMYRLFTPLRGRVRPHQGHKVS